MSTHILVIFATWIVLMVLAITTRIAMFRVIMPVAIIGGLVYLAILTWVCFKNEKEKRQRELRTEETEDSKEEVN